jgi:hypothetical protein
VKLLAVLLPAAALSACATASPLRLHSEQELGRIASGCGLALGEVVQEEDEPRLLFLLAPAAAPRQVRCVRRWSRRNSLHFVNIEVNVEAPR